MPQDHGSRTSVTLLGRLRREPSDQAAWNDFVARYQPKILKWCRRWRLQETDAHDITQAVLLKLSRLMANFAYDPSRSFRAWLKTLTHHAWRDLVAERNRAGIGSGDSRMGELFENIQAASDLEKYLEEEFQRELMEQAMALVRPRVAAQYLGRVPPDGARGSIRRRCRRTARYESGPGLCGQERSQGDDPPHGPQSRGDRMNHCPDRDRLERLLTRGFEGTELDEIEGHIEGCAACQQVLDELTGDDGSRP